MKHLRLLIGVAIVVLGLWAIVGEQMAGASADAVINAPVVTLRAPTAGRLQLPEREIGSHLQAGEVLATVTDTLVDRMRLNDLTMEASLAQAGMARDRRDLEAAMTERSALLSRADTFRTERLNELRAKLAHARARLALIAPAEAKAELPAQTPAKPAAKAAAAPAAPSRTAKTLPDVVAAAEGLLPGEPRADALIVDHARERVELLEIALRAAEQGVFLGDGYNDAPAAEQRASVLDTEIAGLQSKLAEDKDRMAALADRLDRERLRVNDLTGGDIAAPADGTFWQVLAADGVTVQRGDPILRLLDCSASVVTLSVTERVYDDLKTGDPATFRPAGSDTVYPATVARLGGAGAATLYETMAVAPSQKHLERYDVTLDVPALRTDPAQGCRVGHTGRAYFDARPLDWLRSWLK